MASRGPSAIRPDNPILSFLDHGDTANDASVSRRTTWRSPAYDFDRQLTPYRTMPKSIDTKLIHAGEPEPRVEGAVAMPIFQSAMFEYRGDEDEVRYVRYGNNPNQIAVQEKLATVESGEDAIVTSSGMAAISSALLSVLSPGDHLLAQNKLYGGTHRFLTAFLTEYGINYDFIDLNRPDEWRAALRPQSKAIYVETITNPLIEVGDLGAVSSFAKEHGLTSLIDNTFASPVNFRPLEWGYDISLHSATKYLNGHSDLVAGAAIGHRSSIEAIRNRVKMLGGSLDPHACYLLHRGLKTLGIRIQRQNSSALELAQALHEHPAVDKVNYAGLATSPFFANATRHLDGYGGMLSFELRGDEELTETFMRSLTVPILAPSLGSVETLIVRPAATSHAGLSPRERADAGISDRLIRVSVGIESAADLVEDFTRALSELPTAAEFTA